VERGNRMVEIMDGHLLARRTEHRPREANQPFGLETAGR
jgi:hypothetical protein